MKKSKMRDYMRLNMWMERVYSTMYRWEEIQGVQIPDGTKDTISKFMRRKIKYAIKKGTLMRTLLQIAVTSLIYIKMKGNKK